MKLKNMFPSKYMVAADLDGDTVLGITSVGIEEVGPDRQEKHVVRFSESQKGLILNVTNAKTIGDLYGEESDAWAGRRVTLYPTRVEFKGKSAMGIRVRDKV